MLEEVISGGQVGADLAGLIAAKSRGFQTGGWAPRGFKTKNGPNPELKTVFGLVETARDDYPSRTRLNVMESDGTIRFAYDWKSRGEICTANAITKYLKPHLDVTLRQGFNGEWYCFDVLPDAVLRWIRDNKIRVLNVAGNANPDIEDTVIEFLCRVFDEELP